MGAAIGGQAIAITEFYRPDIFMLANATGALKAARESWAYSRELEKDGFKDAAKEAKKAFWSDTINVFVSLVPLADTIIKTGIVMATWGIVIPAAISLTVYSNQKIAKAREIELTTLWKTNEGMNGAQNLEYSLILAKELVRLYDKYDSLVAKGKADSQKIKDLRDTIVHKTNIYCDVVSYM